MEKNYLQKNSCYQQLGRITKNTAKPSALGISGEPKGLRGIFRQKRFMTKEELEKELERSYRAQTDVLYAGLLVGFLVGVGAAAIFLSLV